MVANDHNVKGDELPNQYNYDIQKNEMCGYNNTNLKTPCLKEQGKCSNNISTLKIPLNNSQLIKQSGCEDSEKKHDPILFTKIKDSYTKHIHNLECFNLMHENMGESNVFHGFNQTHTKPVVDKNSSESIANRPTHIRASNHLKDTTFTMNSSDRDFDVISEFCEAPDTLYQHGHTNVLDEEKLEGEQCFNKHRDEYPTSTILSYIEDNSIHQIGYDEINQSKYYSDLHNTDRSRSAARNPKINHCDLMEQKGITCDGLNTSYCVKDSSDGVKMSNNPTRKTNVVLPIVMLCLLHLLSGNYMLTSFIPLTAASSVNDCMGVRYAYLAKGLDLKDVPRQPRQGSELQICPRGLTCCTEEMEKKLWIVSKDQYGKAIQSSASSMQRLFNQRSNKFDGFFTELLIKSKLKFHRLFRRTYGIIYERNSDVFIDFFRDLESYYDNGNVDLEEALRRFFTQLYQRMFTVFNAQHNFDSTYLSCVSQTMKTLQPFGDVPKKLTEQLRRSFVATRTFSQALMKGKQIINKIVKIQPKDRCVVALTKMSSCPACQGIPEILPCNDYCVNVMKGCLAYHAELDASWDKFIDNLQILADRLMGPFDIEDVVDPIGVKISDAIMNFQNSGYDVTNKVYEDCGTPRIQKRQALSHNYEGYSSQYHQHNVGGKQRSGRGPESTRRNNGGKGSRNGNKRQGSPNRGNKGSKSKLKNYIKDTKAELGETKGFWTRLPYGMCKENNLVTSNTQAASPRASKKIASSSNDKDEKCWNGKDAGRYTNSIVNDGLQHQEYNPEVPIDLSRNPGDAQINQQIRALKSITQKIENAHRGLDVEWPVEGQHGNDFYNEGSGDHDGDRCDPENTDDEDCYYTDYDHSGEGSGEDDTDTNPWNGHNHGMPDNRNKHMGSNPQANNPDDDTTDNYPPWVTPPSGEKNDNGISVMDGNDIDGTMEDGDNKSRDPDVSSKRTSSGERLSPGLSTSFKGRAIIYYMFPAFIVWLGSFITHRTPSASSVSNMSSSIS